MRLVSTPPRDPWTLVRALLAPAAILIFTAGVSASSMAAAGKAPAIKPAFNGYFPADFKDTAYQQAAVARVGKNWIVPGGHLPAKGSKTVVQSTIARDGKLGSAVVTMKSGSKEWDDAALAAVTKGAPFAPLPGSYPQSKIEVHWHFTASADGR